MTKSFDSNLKTELVTENSLQNCIDFLEKRKETCLFLLGNLSNYGFKFTDHVNSGNYRLLKCGNKLIGVFSITRRGNLLIQTDNKENYSPEIYKAITSDDIKVKGIIGHWKDCILFKSYCETVVKNFKIKSVSKERLYSLSLSAKANKRMILEQNRLVRFLTSKDFKQWDIFNREYLKETGAPIQGTHEERNRSFEEAVKKKNWWGVFFGRELVSVGAHNTRYKDIGQIGGVFTPPERRRKGYSRLCMMQLLIDSRKIHQLNTLILFTSEDNIAAQTLYESLGFKQVGYFGLIFAH